VAQDEENAQTSKGVKESEALLNALEQRGLRLVEVLPDGDCLYSALAYQCEIIGPAKVNKYKLSPMKWINSIPPWIFVKWLPII
jgi:hypothetical protein